MTKPEPHHKKLWPWPRLSALTGGGLLAAALALWAFAKLTSEVLEKETTVFDRSVLLAIHAVHAPVLDAWMIAVTALGDSGVVAGVAAALCVGLAVRGEKVEGIALLAACAGAAGLNVLLKNLFARTRPQLWQRAVEVIDFSFPSGHAMMSLVVYGLVGYLLAVHLPRWRGLITAATIALVATIGFSRLYLGVHWPTDVIAGYTAGLVWLTACIFTLRLWKAKLQVIKGQVNPVPQDP